MPFKSEAQRRWMHANHPEMAKRWEKHTPKGKKLPEKVKGGIDKTSHVARIAGREYTDISFKEAKKIATSLGSDLFWWDNQKYVFSNGSWVAAIREYVISQDVEVILDNKKYLLEAGDTILIENIDDNMGDDVTGGSENIEFNKEILRTIKNIFNSNEENTNDFVVNKYILWQCHQAVESAIKLKKENEKLKMMLRNSKGTKNIKMPPQSKYRHASPTEETGEYTLPNVARID